MSSSNSAERVIVLVGAQVGELDELQACLEAGGFSVRRASTLLSAAKKLGSSGIILQATVISSPPGLSPREREVRKLQTLGLGKRRIARELAISESSVKVFQERGAAKARTRRWPTAPGR